MLVFTMVLVAISFGFIAAAQGATNAALGNHVGALQAASVSFVGGAIVCGIILIFNHTGDMSALIGIPPWKLLSGFCGAFLVAGTTVCIPHLGVALMMMLGTLGQLVFSVIIDYFGLFEANVIHPTPLRIVGLVILTVGVVLVYQGNLRQSKSKGAQGRSAKHMLPYALLAFSTGFAAAANQPIAAALRAVVGPSEFEFVHFCIGSAALIILCLVSQKGKLAPMKGLAPWKFTGGLYGVYGLFALAISMPVLGSTLSAACNTLGLLVGSFSIDKWGFFESQKQRGNAWRTAGVIVLAVGMCVTMLARMV